MPTPFIQLSPFRPKVANIDYKAAVLACLDCTDDATAGCFIIAPTTLAANGSLGVISLTWACTATNRVGFRIERSTDGVNFTQIGTVGASVLSYDDTTVAAGISYTYRVKCFNYECDSEYSNTATAVALPTPAVSASSTSRTGTATLIGFSEFVSPSVPPKKYRKKTLSGLLQICGYGNFTTCLTGPGGQQGQYSYLYSGAITYNAVTGAITNTTNQQRDNANVVCGAAPSYSNMGNVPTAVETITAGAALNRTQTPTTNVQTSDFTCVAGGILHAPYPERVTACTNRDDLSEEDTEADAIARATYTTGVQTTAKTEARGAGDFTFTWTTVAYALAATNLVAGISYKITITLTTEDYGGGNPVVTTHDINFVAAGASYNTVYNVQAPSGKQVTPSNPVIVFVP